MKKVWIRHPDLGDRDPIEVAESSLSFHINAGWEQVPEEEEPKPEGQTTTEQAEDSQEEQEERKSTRASRSRKAEDKKEAEG